MKWNRLDAMAPLAPLCVAVLLACSPADRVDPIAQAIRDAPIEPPAPWFTSRSSLLPTPQI